MWIIEVRAVRIVTLDAVQTDASACQTQLLLAIAPFTTIHCNPMPADSNSLTSSHFIYRIAFLCYMAPSAF